MSRNLDEVLQNPALVESESIAIDETKAIDEWISGEYSSSYFVDYSEKTTMQYNNEGLSAKKGNQWLSCQDSWYYYKNFY